MKLKADEQKMLDGTEGKARQKAMELLVRYAEALGADSFVDTSNVTIIPGSIPDVSIVRRIVPSLDPDEVASRFMLDSDETFLTTNAGGGVKAYFGTRSTGGFFQRARQRAQPTARLTGTFETTQ